MGYRKIRYLWGCMAAIVLSIFLIYGCADQQTVKKDPFFEKWTTLAETSPGHSPVAKEKSSAIAQELLKSGGPEGEDLAPVRVLPTQRITLKMRQADIRSVLRSLARIVDQNVLVKSEIKGEVTIDFRDVPWSQAFNSLLRSQGLTYTWEGDILRVLTFDDMELDLKRKTQELGSTWSEPLLTVVVSIDYAKPKDLKDNLEALLTRGKDDKPRGSVRVDEYSNSLIVSAIKQDLIKMMAILEKLDKPTPQINIRANIVHTTKTTARDLGIQWGGLYNRAVGDRNFGVTPGGTTTTTGGITTTTAPPAGLSGQGMGVNFPAAMSATASASLGLIFGTLGGNILEMQLNALQTDGKVNILSSPSITTLDNQKAYTENGARVPVVSKDDKGVTTTTYVDATLRLEITPHVIDGTTLKMVILIKKDEVGEKMGDNYSILKRQTETVLIVRDGETIVISGLTTQKNELYTSGVPGMKDAPFLGWLFKNENKDEKMEEVLIFITPKILPPYQVSAAMPAKENGAVAKNVEKKPREKRPAP
ncbi:MAG: type IV pilus secretin PilQ [Syntrophales bacterium]